MIALSILIGCIFIGIELRKGLGEISYNASAEPKQETYSEKRKKERRKEKYTVLGKNYSSVRAVFDKFKEYKPSKKVLYYSVKNGTTDEYITKLIEIKKAKEIKTKEAENKTDKVYVTNKMPNRLLIKYNLKVGDWVHDIPTMMQRTGLKYSTMYNWTKNGYIEIK